MSQKRKLPKPRNKIREEIEKRGVTDENAADAVTFAGKLSEPGGIYRWLRASPLVGANLNLKRERVKLRKIDI